MTATAAGARRGASLEWAAALTAAVASVVLFCWAGRDFWFRLDVWDFLAGREAGSFESWIRPHAGHLQWVTVGVHRLLYGAVGLDFWPWYYLIPVAGYAGLSLLLWRALLRRGTDRGVAFVAYLVVLVLGIAAFLSSIVVGGLIVMALLLWVAGRLDADASGGVGARLLVSGALLLMVTTSSLGVAGLAACLLAVALTGGLRRWWWTFLPGVAAYAAWYAARGGSDPQGSVGWGHLPSLPGDALTLLGNAVGRVFGIDGGGLITGAVAAAALATGLGWLAWKRRLRRWDLVFGGTLGGYLLMVVLVRGAAGKIPLETARYSWPIILLAVPLVVPHLRLPARLAGRARVAVLLVAGGFLVGMNTWDRLAETNALEREAFGGRVAIETVGELVAAGEPAIDGLRLKADLGMGMAGVLTAADVRGFLGDGWEPAPPLQFYELDRVRRQLRFFPLERAVEGEATVPALAAAIDAPEGCVEMRPGGTRRFTVARAGGFTLEAAGRDRATRVALSWRDPFGEFAEELVVTRVTALMAAAPPAGGAGLVVSNLGDKRLIVCGVTGI